MVAPQRKSALGLWLGFATAMMSALAGGAVWCVLVLRTGYELTWFALVCAIVVAWALRANGFAGSRIGAALAALCTALACTYSQFSMMRQSLYADVPPMLTWSSWSWQVGIVSTLAGVENTLFSLTSAAEVYCAIINPEFNPTSLTRKLGKPRWPDKS